MQILCICAPAAERYDCFDLWNVSARNAESVGTADRGQIYTSKYICLEYVEYLILNVFCKLDFLNYNYFPKHSQFQFAI